MDKMKKVTSSKVSQYLKEEHRNHKPGDIQQSLTKVNAMQGIF
jgi:hypothetical protein